MPLNKNHCNILKKQLLLIVFNKNSNISKEFGLSSVFYYYEIRLTVDTVDNTYVISAPSTFRVIMF